MIDKAIMTYIQGSTGCTAVPLLGAAGVEALRKLKARPEVSALLRLNSTTGTDMRGNISGVAQVVFPLEAHHHHQVLHQEEGEQAAGPPHCLSSSFPRQCQAKGAGDTRIL